MDTTGTDLLRAVVAGETPAAALVDYLIELHDGGAGAVGYSHDSSRQAYYHVSLFPPNRGQLAWCVYIVRPGPAGYTGSDGNGNRHRIEYRQTLAEIATVIESEFRQERMLGVA